MRHLKALPLTEHELYSIGRVAYHWSYLEHAVEALIWAMMDLQPAIGRTVTEDLQFKIRWRTAMKLASRDERFIEIKNGLLAQQNEMKALESDRNLIVHGVWQRDPETNLPAAASLRHKTESRDIIRGQIYPDDRMQDVVNRIIALTGAIHDLSVAVPRTSPDKRP